MHVKDAFNSDPPYRGFPSNVVIAWKNKREDFMAHHRDTATAHKHICVNLSDLYALWDTGRENTISIMASIQTLFHFNFISHPLSVVMQIINYQLHNVLLAIH